MFGYIYSQKDEMPTTDTQAQKCLHGVSKEGMQPSRRGLVSRLFAAQADIIRLFFCWLVCPFVCMFVHP